MLFFIFLTIMAVRCSSYNIFLHHNFNHVNEISKIIPYDTRIKIIEEASSILPDMDSFSHVILKTNENLIKIIIETDLQEQQKKDLILSVVDVCRKGDEIGGKILTFYYNLINNIL